MLLGAWGTISRVKQSITYKVQDTNYAAIVDGIHFPYSMRLLQDFYQEYRFNVHIYIYYAYFDINCWESDLNHSFMTIVYLKYMKTLICFKFSSLCLETSRDNRLKIIHLFIYSCGQTFQNTLSLFMWSTCCVILCVMALSNHVYGHQNIVWM